MLDAMDDAGVADVTYEMKEKKVKSERRGARVRPRGYLTCMIIRRRRRMLSSILFIIADVSASTLALARASTSKLCRFLDLPRHEDSLSFRRHFFR